MDLRLAKMAMDKVKEERANSDEELTKKIEEKFTGFFY